MKVVVATCISQPCKCFLPFDDRQWLVHASVSLVSVLCPLMKIVVATCISQPCKCFMPFDDRQWLVHASASLVSVLCPLMIDSG